MADESAFAPLVAEPTIPLTPEPSTFQPTLRDRMSAYTQQSNSFWPTTLAVLAGLTGNFQPAINLQEQKRQTALTQAVTPEMIRIQHLTATGDLEGAQKATEGLAAAVGERAPEIAKMLQQKQQQLYKKQQDRQNIVEQLQALMASGKGEDDPQVGGAIKYLSGVLKRGSTASPEMIAKVVESYTPRIIEAGGGIGRGSAMGGPVEMQPVQEFVKHADVTTAMGLRVAGMAKIDTAQLQNLLNGRDVIRNDGSIIKAGSPEASMIAQRFYELQPEQALVDMFKNMHLEPAIYGQLIAQGKTPYDIITGRIGGAAGMQAAIAGQTARLADVQAAGERVRLRENPFLAESYGQTWMDPRTGQEVTNITRDQATAQGLVPVNQQRLAQTLKPTQNGIQILDTVSALINSLEGDRTKLGTRGADFLNSIFSRAIGTPLGPNTSTLTAIAALAKHAVEFSGNQQTPAINAAMNDLNKYVADPRANPDEALKLLGILRQRLQDVYNMNMPVSGTSPQGAEPASSYREGGTFTPASPETTFTPRKGGASSAVRPQQQRKSSGSPVTSEGAPSLPTPAPQEQTQQQRINDAKKRLKKEF